MIDPFRDFEIWTHALSPMCADVRVRVGDEAGKVRGWLTGPQCRFASTVEVAYPLQPTPGEPGTYRAVIPEPSLWEPECPFLYTIVFESWCEHELWPRPKFTYGLRSLAKREGTMFVNGHPLALRTDFNPPESEEDAKSLRKRGINLIRARLIYEGLWNLADSYGFFLLGELNTTDSEVVSRVMRDSSRHPCLLAWLVDSPSAALLLSGHTKSTWLALPATQAPPSVKMEDVSLLVYEEPEPRVVVA
jgi:hypothetical protein